MSERTTGATPEQIGAAAIVASSVSTRFDWTNDADQDTFVADLAQEMCETLVPPDHRIIGPDGIAALRTIADAAESWAEYLAEDRPNHAATILAAVSKIVPQSEDGDAP